MKQHVCIPLLILLCATTSIYGYWQTHASGNQIVAKRYQRYFHPNGPYTTITWNVGSGDKFIPMEYLSSTNHGAFTLFIKPGKKWMLAYIDDATKEWRAAESGGMSIGSWPTKWNDKYVSGYFDSAGRKSLLAANPDGRYATLKLEYTPQFNVDGFTWTQIQYASNGDISSSDKLISGMFEVINPNPSTYVALIKSSGCHVMKYNRITNNWDILSSTTTGQIYWWVINSNDHYVVGSFYNAPAEDLLALNPNGWHHTMRFDGNTKKFVYAEGGHGGLIGSWYIQASDRFLAGDFDVSSFSPTDSVVVINHNGHSQTMKLVNNQWTYVSGNNGNGLIGNWHIGSGDHYTQVFAVGYGRSRLISIGSSQAWASGNE